MMGVAARCRCIYHREMVDLGDLLFRDTGLRRGVDSKDLLRWLWVERFGSVSAQVKGMSLVSLGESLGAHHCSIDVGFLAPTFGDSKCRVWPSD